MSNLQAEEYKSFEEIKKIRKDGTEYWKMPEDLPKPNKSIMQVEKEQLKRLKNRKTKLMLDE